MLALHFDYPSPASALAVLRLQRIADEGGRVAFTGVDSLGLDLALPPTPDMLGDIDRVRDRVRELGLTMRRPSRWPPTLAAHLLGDLAEEVGLGASWRSVCLRAYWTDDADLSDDLVLHDLAVTAGLDDSTVADRLADAGLRRTARHRALTRRRRGLGGVPVLESHGTLVPTELPDDDLRHLASA